MGGRYLVCGGDGDSRSCTMLRRAGKRGSLLWRNFFYLLKNNSMAVAPVTIQIEIVIPAATQEARSRRMSDVNGKEKGGNP